MQISKLANLKMLTIKEWVYYFILFIITAFIFLSNPFLKIPYDMWKHLILINSLYTTGENYTFYPDNIWGAQYAWHYIWASFFKLFLVSDIFLRAKIIHVTQFLFTFYVMLYVSKVFIRNLFINISRMTINWLSLITVLIWFTMYGTNGSHYQQSWIMWYSVNYQITLILYWLCTAITIKLFFENPRHKTFLVFLLLSSLVLILLWHAMEFIYYLMFATVLVLVYLDKVIKFVKKHKIKATLTFVALCLLSLKLPLLFEIISRTPEVYDMVQKGNLSLWNKILENGNELIMGLNRRSSSFNILIIISFAFLSAVCAGTLFRVGITRIINRRTFAVIFISSLFFFIPFMTITGGVAGIIVGKGVTSRFIYSSTLFLSVPCFYYVIYSKWPKLLYSGILSLLLFCYIASWLLPFNHIYFKNVNSILFSLFPSEVGIQYSKKDIAIIGKELNKITQISQPEKPYLFYAIGDISWIISGVFKYYVFSVDGKGNLTKAKFDKSDAYSRIIFNTPDNFHKDEIIFKP